ncbi:hypothetical protein SAMN05216370_0001, partial [Pseudomonas peli]
LEGRKTLGIEARQGRDAEHQRLDAQHESPAGEVGTKAPILCYVLCIIRRFLFVDLADFDIIGKFDYCANSSGSGVMDNMCQQDYDIHPYKEEFISIVLRHVNEQLSAEEWQRFRAHAASSKHRIVGGEAKLDATRAEVVRDSLCSAGIGVPDILSAFPGQEIVIGEIAGHSVYCIPSEGYYFWGIDPVKGFIWDVNLCWPAYTPNW